MNSIPSYLFDDPLPNNFTANYTRSLTPSSLMILVESIELSPQYQVEDIVHTHTRQLVERQRDLPVTWNMFVVTMLEKSDNEL